MLQRRICECKLEPNACKRPSTDFLYHRKLLSSQESSSNRPAHSFTQPINTNKQRNGRNLTSTSECGQRYLRLATLGFLDRLSKLQQASIHVKRKVVDEMTGDLNRAHHAINSQHLIHHACRVTSVRKSSIRACPKAHCTVSPQFKTWRCVHIECLAQQQLH
ncbi:hypothetical protein BJ741DRAFT_392406 [Chytriomyces cf. hyalinus JEL632]|nr:hypothetical protein BJ741DRAFT_392406 [Chytriomyces cf. hyalinus JEL632]